MQCAPDPHECFQSIFGLSEAQRSNMRPVWWPVCSTRSSCLSCTTAEATACVHCWCMLFIVHFKIVDISLEVSQKSTFQELLKTANSHPSLPNTSIASIQPLKKPSKTLIILNISLKSPPEDFIWALDVSMLVNQKSAKSHSKKTLFREWSPFWVVRICI